MSSGKLQGFVILINAERLKARNSNLFNWTYFVKLSELIKLSWSCWRVRPFLRCNSRRDFHENPWDYWTQKFTTVFITASQYYIILNQRTQVLSCLLSQSDLFYLFIVGVEGYCCTCSHSMTHTHTHSVGLPWTRDRHVAETFTWQRTTLTREKTAISPSGFKPAIPASQTPWGSVGIKCTSF
jgi:hypothetical protein